ncbi:uncharacterized protein LOC134255297, partial [Saccostrea cucullata]|uniref:uncharacterized protein LOC134255297 n=1 Tax=Saccostrea cuccullata TaxID=36930 RepID=UPI002ED1956A
LCKPCYQDMKMKFKDQETAQVREPMCSGISIAEYCFSEPQAGKSYCDSKIAHMRMKMKSYAASGHDILTASDMKHALDAGSGVRGCQVANVAIDTTKQLFSTHKMKNVNNYSSITYQEDGMIVRKAYNIGRGLLMSNLDIRKFTSSKHEEHTSGCLILEPFITPAMQKGEIRTKSKENSDGLEISGNNAERETAEDAAVALFYCPEVGCTKKYSTYRGLETHLLCGKHQMKLDKKSTFDQIKLQWAQLCSEVVITCKNVLSSKESVEKELKAEPMGWGLRKPRKISRFPEKVKDYLMKKYENGKKGRKAVPSEVAEEMRVVTDEDGSKLFSVSEWLSTAQITSFFSRMASKGYDNKPVTEDFDDKDLLAALEAIEEDALIENINLAS